MILKLMLIAAHERRFIQKKSKSERSQDKPFNLLFLEKYKIGFFDRAFAAQPLLQGDTEE